MFKEGFWVDFATHMAPTTPIPWLHISEPTGFIGGVHNISNNQLNIARGTTDPGYRVCNFSD